MDKDIALKKYVKLFIRVLLISFIFYYVFLRFFDIGVNTMYTEIMAISFIVIILLSYLIVLIYYLIELTKRCNTQEDDSNKDVKYLWKTR